MVLGFSGTNPPPSWLADREEVAVRIPRNNCLLDLMRATGVLVVTSANRHGAATPASAGEAGAQLTPHVELVVDAGTLDVIPSTLVNLRGGQAVVEREGAISGAAIAEAIASAAATSAAMEVPT
jgi:L-threonylcarbamoyladenylate synthase